MDGTLWMRIGGTLWMRIGGTLWMRIGGTLWMRIGGTLSLEWVVHCDTNRWYTFTGLDKL